MSTQTIDETLMATCGMNCAICIGHLRQRDPCAGCNGSDEHKPMHCVVCRIKNCEKLQGAPAHFCYTCGTFPCARLKQLDKRYRARYGMSMVENLRRIQSDGMEAFLVNEAARWRCPQCGELLSAHRDECLHCGAKKEKEVFD